MVGNIITKSPLTLACSYEGKPHEHEVGFIKPLDQTLREGDICLFYGQYSIIDKIQNPQEPYEKQVAEISTETTVSEEDAKWLKTEAGTVGWMKHGFSLKQLVKVIPIDDSLDLKDFEILENRTRKECAAIKNFKYDQCKCWTSEQTQPECQSLTPRLVRGKLVIIEKQ